MDSTVLTLGGGVFSGVLVNGASAGSLVKVGGATLSLSGANTYTGATTVNAGTVELTGSLLSGLVSVGTQGALNVRGGGLLPVTATLGVDGAASFFNPAVTLGTLNGSGAVTMDSTVLTLGGGVFSGVLADGASPGSLVKVGGATLSLSGANTYTGTTTVNAGTVELTGSLLSGLVSV
jgi:autotransporter-associated beta strand protein